MKQERKILLILFLCGFWTIVVQAQDATLAAGGKATGAGGSATYSVGQIANKVQTGSNGSVIQGVQQPYEISVVTGIEEALEITLDFLVYPNPTTDFITLKTGSYSLTNLSYQLLSLGGNTLENKKIDKDELVISMRNQPSSIYFLMVYDQKRLIKTFKIIKN
jgi:hypothetical protein